MEGATEELRIISVRSWLRCPMDFVVGIETKQFVLNF